jgi:hypothetical protein
MQRQGEEEETKETQEESLCRLGHLDDLSLDETDRSNGSSFYVHLLEWNLHQVSKCRHGEWNHAKTSDKAQGEHHLPLRPERFPFSAGMPNGVNGRS